MSKILGPTTDPQLFDLLDDIKRESNVGINCIQIATIESYNPLLNTAKVSINFKIKLQNDEIKEYPPLEDCPVFIIGGGDSYVSFPIKKGDTCLVLFNDVCMDNWYLTGEIKEPDSTRSHSIADGIVLVGIKPVNDPRFNSLKSMLIEGGSKKISIRNDDADLKSLIADQTTTIKSMIDTIKDMNTQINSVLDAIAALTVTCVAPGSPSTPPINAATFTTAKTSFEGYNTSLDGYKTDLNTFTTDIAKLLDEGLT